jgi:hypothetical protein
MGDDGHLDLLMTEIRTLRMEFHEMRRELKSEAVRLASQVECLESWRNKQLGALALMGAVAGMVGAGIIKFWSAVFGRG